MAMKIVIIPDVHGRAFWKEAVERFLAERFIFLGDYLDPYYFDVIYHEITPESTIENFQEILSFKKANPNRVTLLLVNHDCGYLYGKDVCDYRCDDGNYALIQGLFRENTIATKSFDGNISNFFQVEPCDSVSCSKKTNLHR